MFCGVKSIPVSTPSVQLSYFLRGAGPLVPNRGVCPAQRELLPGTDRTFTGEEKRGEGKREEEERRREERKEKEMRHLSVI
jgi:hypothetical protein